MKSQSSLHTDPKTDVEWFKYYLYSDPDFLVMAEQFSEWFESAANEDTRIVLSLTSSKADPLKPQLEKQLGRCKGVELIEATAQKFEIPEHVVEYGFIKHPKYRGVSDERRPIILGPRESVNAAENELVIKVFPNTRIEDLQEIWTVVEGKQKELAGYVPQLKSALNYRLIYAIYKQRLLRDGKGKRTTFERIFGMYEAGALPGYSDKNNIQFNEGLERLYNRHKPRSDSM